MHRRNAAERDISTFEYGFIEGLSATNPDFPMHNWERLLEQVEITLNLLSASIFNLRLSAYAQLNGELDFNCIPMDPPGTRTLVHDKPNNRGM